MILISGYSDEELNFYYDAITLEHNDFVIPTDQILENNQIFIDYYLNTINNEYNILALEKLTFLESYGDKLWQSNSVAWREYLSQELHTMGINVNILYCLNFSKLVMLVACKTLEDAQKLCDLNGKQ